MQSVCSSGKDTDMGTRTSLVIMAAGLGSRFGKGIKQLTSFGPHGEIIMDYSVFDAMEAGFDRIIFVLRKDLEKDFKEIIGDRISRKVEVGYAFQELTDLPEGFALPEGRKKPWGTGQAVLACRDLIREPFAVINADDYYGKEAFVRIHDHLVGEKPAKGTDSETLLCMAGFVLKNTLSEHGGVTRGICSVDEDGRLNSIAETKNIIKVPGGAAVLLPDGNRRSVDPESLVSMNFWGFPEEMIGTLEERFRQFLQGLTPKNCLTEEFLLPIIVNDMLQSGKAQVSVCPSSDRWFGVTYQEDIPLVKESFRKLIADSVYKENLWEK